MASSAPTVHAQLGFTRPEDVSPDADRPGLLRARTLPFDADMHELCDFHRFPLVDCSDDETAPPSLEREGFEVLDLSGLTDLQSALRRIRAEDHLSDELAAALRAAFDGRQITLHNGSQLRIDHIADDGMIMRRAGANGRNVNPDGMDGGNGHDAAMMIHGDQDVFGTPLVQTMGGSAPDLFRHRTPDAINDTSATFLLNLWIPLQQVSRPLVLMDRTTLDASRHQLRYGLPVSGFLDRDEDQSVNDIWHFLPDPAQRWYFSSSMSHDRAYVFDTLGLGHGSCILPGEDALAELVDLLGAGREAVSAGDRDMIDAVWSAPRPELHPEATQPIRDAAAAMTSLLDAIDQADDQWVESARTAGDATIRKSIEMRVVATLVS